MPVAQWANERPMSTAGRVHCVQSAHVARCLHLFLMQRWIYQDI